MHLQLGTRLQHLSRCSAQGDSGLFCRLKTRPPSQPPLHRLLGVVDAANRPPPPCGSRRHRYDEGQAPDAIELREASRGNSPAVLACVCGCPSLVVTVDEKPLATAMVSKVLLAYNLIQW